MTHRILTPPLREYVLIAAVAALLAFDVAGFHATAILAAAAALGSLPTLWGAFASLARRHISIDVFNSLALVISFAAREIRSAAFIVLMLSFARLLDAYTESRMTGAIQGLLRLKPSTAFRETSGSIEEVAVETVRTGDLLVVKPGGRIPVDGVVAFGTALVNESLVTGESALVEKVVGDAVLSSTLNESGVMKICATRVGKDSTIERMASLVAEAIANKSRSEKLADRFAQIFLPFVGLLGLVTYVVTHNLAMTASIFLVACADDMAVAIPLAMSASLGTAAKRGVIIKGGEWLSRLGTVSTVVFDKTGTLTYGKLAVREAEIAPGVSVQDFWRAVAVAEKFSEHPVGRAIFREAVTHVGNAPDPDEFRVWRGSGVWVRFGDNSAAIGNEDIANQLHIALDTDVYDAFHARRGAARETLLLVLINGAFAGTISVTDTPRAEAHASIAELSRVGVRRVLMFTGDAEEVATDIAGNLGISEFRASMSPEDKLRELESLEREGVVAMVGDGINDAPALARADVGIAMGSEGTAVAVEAADVVMLTDDLARLPEIITLGRSTTSVIRADMAIWGATNLIGFLLVFTGFIGPALAAFYNFATDFLPLVNSARLFRRAGAEK